MFFKSIRFKVLLWYMGLLTITLLAFSAALYGSFNKVLINNLEDLLSSRAEGVADAINTCLHDKAGQADLGLYLDIARDWVEEKRKDPELMKVFIQILDVQGKRVVASKAMPFITPIGKSDFADLLRGEDNFETLPGIGINGSKGKFRVYYKPVIENGKVSYIVQAAGPIDLISLALQNLVFILFLLLPLTVILAGIPGVLLAGLTLKPVDSMIKTLKQITAENLKLKIHIPDTKDEIKRLADTFNDMVERLDRSFTSQQSFIQDISEELKAPLAAMKLEFDSAIKNAGSKDERENALRAGLKEIGRFSEVIEDLLALAKFDNSQMPFEIKKTDLTDLLGRVVGAAKNAAAEKDISVSSFLQNTIIIDADGDQLSKLFRNIIENSIKYTLRKGRVTVSVRRNGDYAVVSVSDTGVGMPEDELSYIFDRFYQINKSRSSRSGFGLGLSIAKSIAEAHRGGITVESQVGKGSVFTVTLPVAYPG